MTTHAVSFVNARLGSATRTSLRWSGARITAVGAPPAPGDIVIDAAGDRLLPGLINAHDHLQLNNFPRLKFRERHENVGEWIADIDARRAVEPGIADNTAIPREARLRLGGIKNILSGVTTVAHHDPLYPSLLDGNFPCRVLADYGWSHSLALDGAEKVRASCLRTPAQQPWFIHAGEGVDSAALAEFAQLERLDCLRGNSLFIHGVAFTAAERERLAAWGAGLIWCPSSNLFLLGRTADCADLIARGRVALGSDSRLSGTGDLLTELGVARDCIDMPEAWLEALVTSIAASLLRLSDLGRLRAGAMADCVVLPEAAPLGVARRADLRCVVLDGRMRYGDADYAERLMSADDRIPVIVDGRDKILHRSLVDVLRSSPLQEPGVRLSEARGRAA